MSKLPRGLLKDEYGYRIQFNSKTMGCRWRKRLPEGTTRLQAERMLSHVRELDFRRELLPPNETEQQPEPKPATPSIGEFATQVYLPYCQARNTPATLRAKRQALEATAPWFWDALLDQIDLALVHRYQTERKEEGVRNRTVNMQWETIRHLLAHAYKLGVTANPPPSVDPLPTKERDRKPFRFLTPEEAEQALENAADKGAMWYALTLFLLSTGARWGETRALRWSDVDFVNQQVYLRAESAKHGRSRFVPLLPELLDALSALPRCEDNDSVWMRRHHLTGEWLSLKQGAKAISGRYPWQGRGENEINVSPHVYRHTFVTWRLQRGEDLGVISAYLGHSSVALTKDTYGHIQPIDRREAIENAPRPQIKRLRLVGEK